MTGRTPKGVAWGDRSVSVGADGYLDSGVELVPERAAVYERTAPLVAARRVRSGDRIDQPDPLPRSRSQARDSPERARRGEVRSRIPVRQSRRARRGCARTVPLAECDR